MTMPSLPGLSRALERWVSRVTLAFAWLALPLLTALTVVSVAGRRFGLGGEELYELGGDVFFGLVMLSFGYAYQRDGHVRIDIFRERIPARWLAGIELLGCLAILMPLSAFLIVYGGESAWRAWRYGERQSATGLPLQWAVKAFVPLGFLGLLLASVSVMIRNGLFLFGRTPGPAPTPDE